LLIRLPCHICRCIGEVHECERYDGQTARVCHHDRVSTKHHRKTQPNMSFWATVCKTVRPIFFIGALSVCLSCPVCDVGVFWPNGWMDQDATWYGGGPRPRPHCVRWGPSSSPSKRGHSSPHLSAHVYCGQTVAHLSYTAELLLLGAVVYSRAHARHVVTDLDALTRPVQQRTSTLASRARTATRRRPDNARKD